VIGGGAYGSNAGNVRSAVRHSFTPDKRTGSLGFRVVAVAGSRCPFFFRCEGSTGGIQSKHAPRLRLILGRLSVAAEPRDMGLPASHFIRSREPGTEPGR